MNLTHSATAGSDLAGLHRPGNPELAAAIASLPGYAETAQHLATLAATPVPRVLDLDIDGAAERILAALAAGETVPPPEVGKMLARSYAERRSAEAVGLSMQRARVRLLTELDSGLYNGENQLCRHLSQRVAEVVNAARALRVVPMSADEALDTGSEEEYRSAATLARAYADVRAAQQRIADELSGDAPRDEETSPASVLWFLRNPGDIDPHLARAATGVPYSSVDDENDYLSRGHSWPWPKSWRIDEALWWFRDHTEAVPWVPTPTELADSRAALSERFREHSGARVVRKEVAFR